MEFKSRQISRIAGLIAIILAGGASAQAQDAGFGLTQSTNRVNTIAGLHLTVPFGSKTERTLYKPRFGFTLDVERQYPHSGYSIPQRIRRSALDFGLGLDGTPVFLVGEQDLLKYPGPDQKQEIAGNHTSKKTLLVIAGGVLATGAVVALASKSGGSDGESREDRDGDRDD